MSRSSSSPSGRASATAEGMTISYLSPTDPITETGRGPCHRRADLRVPLRPGHRGAGGDAHLDPRAEGVDLRRERQPLLAQHPDPARGPHPRRPQLRPLPRRDPRTLGRPGRGALRPALLADVGQRERRDVPRRPARHVQVHPRPGVAAGQQGLHPAGGRRGHRAAARAGPQVVQPPVPRHRAPRRARGVHQGAGHVGRRPGVAAPPRAGRDGQTLRRSHRRREDPRRGQARLRRRRLPLGRPDPAQPRLRPTATTRTRRTCKPTPTSRWATRPRHRSGAASS